ncbi:MAG: SpoIVB peptidase [Lachnospiraceae bacterium]|nr:SpoIVB peptidase [Lachnospiraceae bacterium]
MSRLHKYRVFLRVLFMANILFIFVVAGLGYAKERREHLLKPVSGSIEKRITPVGKTVGIYVNTKGILVIDTCEVTDIYGNTTSPAKNKLIKGDYITALNDEKVSSKKQLIEQITKCKGKNLDFLVDRNGKNINVLISPVETGVNMYKIGIWVRDDLQGLGTITYVENGKFGALGHSITDSDTGEMMQVSAGKLYLADIYGVEKGTSGTPGEIEGMITYDEEKVVGDIETNKLYGIYGSVADSFLEYISDSESLEIADESEVKTGKAWIQTYVSGKKTLYEIEIANIHKNKNGDKEMEVIVTDDDLINLTGGIVQGMSGSPVIQNNKVVGAVTHVFVNDPTRGYAIFIDKMLS